MNSTAQQIRLSISQILEKVEDQNVLTSLLVLVRDASIEAGNFIRHEDMVKKFEAYHKQKMASESPIYWLEQLAKANSFSSVADPVAWQREIRKDRVLPR